MAEEEIRQDTQVGSDVTEDTSLSSIEETTVQPVLSEETTAEEETQAYSDKVFGQPRPIFRGIAIGIGVGLIVQGLCGAAGLQISSMLSVIVCGALGWFLSKKWYTKQQAENAAQQPAEESQNKM